MRCGLGGSIRRVRGRAEPLARELEGPAFLGDDLEEALAVLGAGDLVGDGQQARAGGGDGDLRGVAVARGVEAPDVDEPEEGAAEEAAGAHGLVALEALRGAGERLGDPALGSCTPSLM